jgi:hypothetical protein
LREREIARKRRNVRLIGHRQILGHEKTRKCADRAWGH